MTSSVKAHVTSSPENVHTDWREPRYKLKRRRRYVYGSLSRRDVYSEWRMAGMLRAWPVHVFKVGIDVSVAVIKEEGL